MCSSAPGSRGASSATREDSNYTLSTRGPGPAYYEPAAVLENIARSRPEVDVLVVSVHAGPGARRDTCGPPT